MKFLIRLVLCIGLVAGGPAQDAQPTSTGRFVTIGNAGVPLMFVPWGSPQLQTLQQQGLTALQYEQLDLARLLKASATPDVQGIEYYIGWGVVEPNQDHWDWIQTQLDAQAIKAKGIQFIPYGWVQNLPTWVRNDPSYPRATNVDNGLETDSLSIYALETKAAYDRFYRNLKTNLGTYIDELRLGSPYDYGECAYPNGAGQDVFPLKNAASGFWVGEAVARDDFRAAMQTKYGSLANLNAAWGTAFTAFSSLPYPTNTTQRRFWLDFIDWYHTGNTGKMGELVDVVREYFPTTLLNINLGWPYEKLNLGQDISGFAQLAAQKSIFLRRGSGRGVPFLSSKRASTALRYYGGQLLGSEPTANDETVSSLATTFFKDLSDGVHWHFDYAGNLTTGAAVFKQFRQIGSSVSDRQARIDTAVFFPTTSHRLDDWDSWRQPGLSGGYPGNLQPFCDQVRDVLDYGVIDERMIGDAALNQYKILAWPVGTVAEAQTMTAISAWVQNGGVLLALDFTSIRDVDGNPGAFAALSALPKVGDMRVAGQGLIFDAAGNLQRVMQWIVQRGNMKPLNANYPTQISTLPVIDNASDGVLTTEFTNGVLLFNSTSSMVTVTLPPLDGQGPAQQVAVPSLGLSWVDRITQLPTITLFTPASAPVGATVTITGTNLTGAMAVRFNGITANIISNTATQIVVTVPAGAISGTISVTITGGTATSTIVYTVPPTPMAQVGTVRNGLVAAFDLDETGASQIFTFAADGGGKKQLTTKGQNDYPSWTRDGSHILFSSGRTMGLSTEIWMMDSDGSNPKQITLGTPAGGEITPFASPDGKQVAFTRYSPVAGHPDIWVIDIDGTNLRQLTTTSIPAASPILGSVHPTWSADGKKIAYASSQSGSIQIWQMNADGSNPVQMTSGNGANYPDSNVPDWSLDGKKITFWSGFETKYGEVWVMDADGQNKRRVTNTVAPRNSDNPHWSADGTQILFASNQEGNDRVLYVVDAAGGVPRQFAKGMLWGTWQPVRTTPGPAIASVNTAGGFPDIAQNDWIEIKGSNLAPASVGPNGMTWNGAPEFSSGRMPTQLSNVSVTVNGKPAFVYFISPAQINVLTPLDSSVGPVQIVVTNGSDSTAPFTANLHAVAPSFLRIGSGNYIAATHSDGSLLGPASMSVPGYTFTPAQPGETIILYAVGFGLPVTTLVNGSSTQFGSLPTMPAIRIGGVAATVQSAGVVSPGLYQFNVVVPAAAGVVNGDNAVTATYGGSATPAGSAIAVQR